MKILVFGNPEIKEDSLATEIAEEVKIKGYEFITCNNPDDILFYSDEDLYIMDVVKDIDEVKIIDNIEMLKKSGFVSLHDFDVAYFLKLLKKLNKIDKIKIIGLPQKGNKEKIKKRIIKVLSKEFT